MGLYEKLHGISEAKPTFDSELESDIQAYADLVVEEESKNFQAGLESLSTYQNKVRQEVVHAMHEFYDTYAKGYEAICEALVAHGEKKPEVPDENLKIFDDTDAFLSALEEGKSISDLLGYSDETLTHFYVALQSLFEKEEYQKVRDGFFFLITIQPETTEYWIGLGIACTYLEDTSMAENAFLEALELDPSSQDAYMGLLHLYWKERKRIEADTLCDRGIAIARSSPEEPWATELESTLLDAKKELVAELH